MANNSNIKGNGKQVQLKQTTNYPLTGNINLEISPKDKQEFTLKIRVPSWVQNAVVPGNLYSYADKKDLKYTV